MIEWAQEANIFIQYIVLFLLALAPWMDVSIIVPLGIVWGLPAISVSVVAFFGNFLLLFLLGIFFKQIDKWRENRKQKKGIINPTKKEKRSREIWEKYGIPGLALLAPIFVGTDIAAIIALTFGSSKIYVVGWMTFSLAVWTIVFAVGSVYGFSLLNLI
ncbi:small multi-drug export protein [Metabacillus malikii]|uniref:Membrane protein n=1 Tax=Metabacillus malikii TaxID=1504265 RepID=A0ABT9Z9X0_9BACI|nr:small multi-drug export protein [Metabacillus malikii]MDQ0229048.1 putative membrane protein [Metabacillus malikii]